MRTRYLKRGICDNRLKKKLILQEKENTMKRPLINWDTIAELARPPMPPRKGGESPKGAPGKGIGGWDNQAIFYNQMAQMETGFTLNQINCFDTSQEDTVLDVGCGPGRITVPMAKRAKSVTALDASPKMLEFCRKNAETAGLSNVRTKLFDWEDKESASDIETHDIVIASRSIAMSDIERLCSLARKYVVLIIWSHGCPSIPQIIGKLFEGLEERRMGPPVQKDRRLGNNLWYNRIYDMGYNVNLNIVEDGFTKDYASREEAYQDLARLKPELAQMGADKQQIFRNNTDRFLTENKDGSITFLSATKSIVLWWKPAKEE